MTENVEDRIDLRDNGATPGGDLRMVSLSELYMHTHRTDWLKRGRDRTKSLTILF